VGFYDGQKWRWGRFSPRTSVSPANLHSICSPQSSSLSPEAATIKKKKNYATACPPKPDWLILNSVEYSDFENKSEIILYISKHFIFTVILRGRS
jgi:hypothetical protein